MTQDASTRLPPRDPQGHKGTFGTVLVVGGSCFAGRRMIGAPALAAHGALRAGAGLVQVLTPRPVANPVLALAPFATAFTLRVDRAGGIVPHDAAAVLDGALAGLPAGGRGCLAIGPGLGACAGAAALALRSVQQEDVPVVIDADALNALAQMPELWRDFRARAILTPHPGEYRRLAQSLHLTADLATPAGRTAAAEALAQRLGCVVVLKGAGTVVTDGHDTWVCPQGHACLATGGTGDVLTGIIAGLVAQFAPPSHAPALAQPAGVPLAQLARAAVLAHALAGERWAADQQAQAGLNPEELAELVPAALETLREGP